MLDREGHLFRGGGAELSQALDDSRLLFHRGRIRGALPGLLA